MILYIDPSVMTYAIQAVAGIAIAVGAFVGIYFRRAKKKINNKLGRDENKNKEVETDEIIINEEVEEKKSEADIKKEDNDKTKSNADNKTKATPKKNTNKKKK